MTVGGHTVLAAGTLLVGLALLPSTVGAQRRFDPSPVEPHRAERIRIACDDARTPDWQRYVMGGALIATGGALYLPNLFENPSIRPEIASLQRGLGVGLLAGGAVMLLLPNTGEATHLLETCDRLHVRDADTSVVLRDAERQFNAVAMSQRTYDLQVGLLAAGVTVVGAGVSLAAISDPRDRLFWAGVFLSAPLALWLQLLVPPPPVRAALRFHAGHYRVPRDVMMTVLPTANGITVLF